MNNPEYEKLVKSFLNSDFKKNASKNFSYLERNILNEDKIILPNNSQINDFICTSTEKKWPNFKTESFATDFIDTSFVRDLYVKHSFPLLTHELIVNLKNLFKQLKVKNIIEVCAGPGWLSHWLKIYGVEILKTTDNLEWKDFQNYLDFVECEDALQTITKETQAELIILSWPYIDDTAFNIWNKLKTNQYLLYIGEGEGRCTANIKFFKAVENHEIEINNINETYLQFFGIHDRVRLFRKKERR